MKEMNIKEMELLEGGFVITGSLVIAGVVALAAGVTVGVAIGSRR
ncbi:MAG: class IIb bacteriocin, lactobin A/cerein 7B family [Culicoidibacterales bacterium]